MAIAFTKTNRPEEAIRCYRQRARDRAPVCPARTTDSRSCCSSAATSTGAEEHLEAFLATPPTGAEAERWIHHARETLDARGGCAAGEDSVAEDAEHVTWDRSSQSSARKGGVGKTTTAINLATALRSSRREDAARRRRSAGLGPLRTRAQRRGDARRPLGLSRRHAPSCTRSCARRRLPWLRVVSAGSVTDSASHDALPTSGRRVAAHGRAVRARARARVHGDRRYAAGTGAGRAPRAGVQPARARPAAVRAARAADDDADSARHSRVARGRIRRWCSTAFC